MREVNYWKWNREAFALLAFMLGFFPFMVFTPQVASQIWEDVPDALFATFASWTVYGLAMLTWFAYYMDRAHAQERRLISFNRTWRRYTNPTE